MRVQWTTELRSDGWWVRGLPCGELGPYDTQREAEDDARGVARFFRREATTTLAPTDNLNTCFVSKPVPGEI